MSRAKITGKKTATLLQSEMVKMQNAGEIISHACKVFMKRRKTMILAQARILMVNARRKYKDLKTRTHVAKEIVSTEGYYVSNIKYMSEKLYDPLVAEATQSRSLNPEDVKKIFSQIKVIVGVNESLLAQLQTQMKKWNIDQCLGQIFINMTEFLKVYIQYVNNFDNALKVIEKVRNNDVFAKFLKGVFDTCPVLTFDTCQAQDLDDNKLQSLLIQPIQRIPRYVLLLQTLQKHTQPEHKDYPLISQALTRIKEIADLINSRKKEFDSSRDMLHVAKQLDPPVKDLIVPQRSLVSRGGLFLIQKEKGRDVFLEYHHVLFSDMLLLTSKDVLFDKYNIKHTVPLANSQVELNEDQLLVTLIGPDKKRWQFKLKSTDEAKKFAANVAQAVLTVNATLPSQFGKVSRRVADFQRVMRGQEGGGPLQGPSDSVQVLLRDREGLVWTGLGNGAVQLWDSKKYTCLKEVPIVRDRVYVLLEVEGTVWCSSGLQTVHVIDKQKVAVVQTLNAEKEVIKAMILVNNKPLQSDEDLDMLRLMKLSSPRSKSKMTVVKMRKERGRINGPQPEALFDEEESSSGPRHDVWTASCVEGLIIIWDTQTYKEKGRIRVPQGVSAMCQCINYIWAGSVDGDLFVINLDTHEIVEVVKGHKGLINAVIVEDNKIWSASNDFILIHDAETRKVVKKIDCPGKCLSLTAVPSRSQVWSGMWTKEIVIWDAKKLEFVQELKDRHKDGVRTIIQTNENEMWTGGRELDRAICVWQLATIAPTPNTSQSSFDVPSLRSTQLFSTLRADSFVPDK